MSKDKQLRKEKKRLQKKWNAFCEKLRIESNKKQVIIHLGTNDTTFLPYE